MARPKYLDELKASMDRMARQLSAKRSWLIINCGMSGTAAFKDLAAGAGALEAEAREMRQEFERRSR